MIWASLFLLLCQAKGETPFWKAKEKIHRRIQEERAIVVAVHTDAIAGGERLIFGGGGQISTPVEFAFRQAMNFENLKQVSDYIKEVRNENGLLFLRTKAFGFEAKMWLKVISTPNSDIHFEIMHGTLKGLNGDLHLEKIESAKTEIGISGRYDYVHFPIAKIFAEFGIEVVLQRMAIRLRGWIEDQYRNSFSGKAKSA